MEINKLRKGVYEVTFIINLYRVLAVVIIASLLMGLAFLFVWLLPLVWKGIVWLAMAIWSIKWWLLGAAGLALLIWLLSKIKWPKHQPNKERKECKERKFPWWMILILLLVIASSIFFLCRNCSGKEEKPELVVTPERYENADGWHIGDTYFEGCLNIRYAEYQKFASYGFTGTLDERKAAFEPEGYSDWSALLEHLKGKHLNDDQLAAITLYGLWNGLAGFEKSSICKKLQSGEKITAFDFAKVYTKTGKTREYQTDRGEIRAKKYGWFLGALYQGDITLNEILNMPVKSYEKISVEEMYTPQGKYISPSTEMKKKLLTGANQTTRKVLGL